MLFQVELGILRGYRNIVRQNIIQSSESFFHAIDAQSAIYEFFDFVTPRMEWIFKSGKTVPGTDKLVLAEIWFDQSFTS